MFNIIVYRKICLMVLMVVFLAAGVLKVYAADSNTVQIYPAGEVKNLVEVSKISEVWTSDDPRTIELCSPSYESDIKIYDVFVFEAAPPFSMSNKRTRLYARSNLFLSVTKEIREDMIFMDSVPTTEGSRIGFCMNVNALNPNWVVDQVRLAYEVDAPESPINFSATVAQKFFEAQLRLPAINNR